MEEKFREFFRDQRYIEVKNSLFNYQNRMAQIKRVFSKLVSINKEIEILDIGSGISPVSPIPERTVYVDISPESAEIMSSWGYNAEVGNINKINKESESFDVILCSEVLEHIEDYKKAISEIHRVLKKNGKAIITVPVHESYWNIDDEFVEHYRRFNPDVLKKDLKNQGFRVILEKPIGSYVERMLTVLLVKIFKQTNNSSISSVKKNLMILTNNILYLVVKSSLVFTSRKSTSIMLYVCEK